MVPAEDADDSPSGAADAEPVVLAADVSPQRAASSTPGQAATPTPGMADAPEDISNEGNAAHQITVALHNLIESEGDMLRFRNFVCCVVLECKGLEHVVDVFSFLFFILFVTQLRQSESSCKRYAEFALQDGVLIVCEQDCRLH